MKIFEDIKKKREEYNSWQSRYERLKESDYNKKARKNFKKMMATSFSEQTLSEEQEAIIFSQTYQQLLFKNPSAAVFPELDECEVKKTDVTYIIKGYADATNSYGAQMRENYELEVYKKDGEWTCITDVGTKYLMWIIIGIVLIALPSIIAYCSMPSF